MTGRKTIDTKKTGSSMSGKVTKARTGQNGPTT